MERNGRRFFVSLRVVSILFVEDFLNLLKRWHGRKQIGVNMIGIHLISRCIRSTIRVFLNRVYTYSAILFFQIPHSVFVDKHTAGVYSNGFTDNAD